jgi:hypothetical protein
MPVFGVWPKETDIFVGAIDEELDEGFNGTRF